MGKNSSADWVAYRSFSVITSVNLIASRATVGPAANTNITSCNGCIAVIELSGVGRVQPPVHFSTPSLFSKITLGVRLNPPRAAFSNSMYLALCLHPKISNTCQFPEAWGPSIKYVTLEGEVGSRRCDSFMTGGGGSKSM